RVTEEVSGQAAAVLSGRRARRPPTNLRVRTGRTPPAAGARVRCFGRWGRTPPRATGERGTRPPARTGRTARHDGRGAPSAWGRHGSGGRQGPWPGAPRAGHGGVRRLPRGEHGAVG